MWHAYGDPVLGPLLHGAGLGILFPALFVAMLVWSFAWKAIALWHSGRNGQRWWFVALLIFNTFGILEIVYLKWYAKDMGAGRAHVFPFLKDVRRELSARMPTSSVPKKEKE
jgi:hypothetical protein